MGIRRQNGAFCLTWNHDNHEMALGILWIRFLSNPCIFWFRYTSVIVLFFGKNCLMFKKPWSRLDHFLSPFSNRSLRFVHHKENANAKRFEFALKVQIHKLWLASTLGQTSSPGFQALHQMGQYDVIIKSVHYGVGNLNLNPSTSLLTNCPILLSLGCFILQWGSKSTNFLVTLCIEHLGTWHTISNLWEDWEN